MTKLLDVLVTYNFTFTSSVFLLERKLEKENSNIQKECDKKITGKQQVCSGSLLTFLSRRG
jgi:hypothetical protein